MNCPCHSGKSYQECCQPFHSGKWPLTALELMRSRYSAYALNLVDYIIETTFPEEQKSLDRDSIQLFSKNTLFQDLNILEFIEGDPISYVTFKAILSQHSRDMSFVEKSEFEKVNGRWFYKKRTKRLSA